MRQCLQHSCRRLLHACLNFCFMTAMIASLLLFARSSLRLTYYAAREKQRVLLSDNQRHAAKKAACCFSCTSIDSRGGIGQHLLKCFGCGKAVDGCSTSPEFETPDCLCSMGALRVLAPLAMLATVLLTKQALSEAKNESGNMLNL